MFNNLNDLTAAQQIFGVFYAIFFGTMLQTVGARSSVSARAKENEKKARKIMSIPIKIGLKSVTLNLFDSPNAWAIKSICFDNKPL